MKRWWISATLVGLLGCGMASAMAQSTPGEPDLSTASLEDLTQMQLRMSSFSRKDQDLWVTPAAVFVITSEDIERSAATSVPELLRMVPGLQVAQLNASTWAVSARGFNSAYANKLLVLIDGRTVYSEIYAGAHWDQNDIPLEEIDRIEVIRGPGAAVWGTNAVNGVINVITRRARSTLGFEASARASRLDGMTHVQFGGSLGDRVQYRGYGFYTQRNPFEQQDGSHAFDGEDTVRGGVRVHWQRSRQDTIVMSGDSYGGHLKQQISDSYNLPSLIDGQDHGSIAGGYLLGRWEHKDPGQDSAAQVYFDDTSRHELGIHARTRTFDAEYQSHPTAHARQDLVWGAEARFTADHISGQQLITSLPEYKNYLIDGFAQDEITLKPRLKLSLGSKIQEGTLAGFQLQPSGRLLWAPNERNTFWTAVSRAVVAEAIQDRSLNLSLNLDSEQGLPVVGSLFGDPAIKPETVVAYEAGYRRRLWRGVTLDAAGFFNVNRRLQSLLVSTPAFVATPSPHIVENLMYVNGYGAKTAGTEVSLSWKPLRDLSLQSSYSWAQARTSQTPTTQQIVLFDTWSTPRNTVTASAFWSFARGWGANAFFSHVDALPTGLSYGSIQGSDGIVKRIERVDLHVSRKVGRNTELDAGGTNLLTPRHIEFGNGTSADVPLYVPRSLFVRARWSF